MKKIYLLVSGLLLTGTVMAQTPCQITPVNGDRCGSGVVDLSASAASDVTIHWYDASTGGNLLHTGTQFTTPSLNTSTTYYLEGEIIGSGPSDQHTINGSLLPQRNWATNTDNWGINFTVHQDMTLDSLAVYPLGTGTITILIRDRNNNYQIVDQAGPFNVTGNGYTGSKVMLPVDIDLTAGDYLLGQSHTGITNIGSQNIGTIGYPFATPLMTLTSGSQGTNSTTTNVYYWFYDINISTGGGSSSSICTNNRIPITASINEIPSFTFDSYNTPICHNEFPITIAPNYGTTPISNYSWSNGGTTPTISINDGGTYSLTVTTAAGCEFTGNVSINKDDRVTSLNDYEVEVVDFNNRIFQFNAGTGDEVLEYLWDFGDGNTGTGQVVAHQYAVQNNYEVTLTGVGPCNNDELTKTLNMGGVSIDEMDKSLVSIYPNPATSHFTIQLENNQMMTHIEMVSIDGRTMTQKEIPSLSQLDVDVKGFASGIYVLKITTANNNTLYHKVLIR